MYADEITPSMKSAIDETNRRRLKQLEYNREHHITPESIRKAIYAPVEATIAEEAVEYDIRDFQKMPREEREKLLREMEADMYRAAENLEFERAARLRDSIRELQQPVKKSRRRGKR
jgi:excinuclease ABC subunit B